MAKISKTQRWLDLITFLVKRRFPVGVDDIMAAVPAYTPKWESGSEKDRQTVRRMFERDKDELRELGIPIETVPYTIDYAPEPVDGYRLSGRDFYLPYLRVVEGEKEGREESRPRQRSSSPRPGEVELTADEAGMAIDALSRVAELPSSPFADASRSALRTLAFDLDIEAFAPAPVLYVPPPGAEDVSERLRALTDAVRARKTASFTYHGIYRGQTTERTVRPYGLLFHAGHWYLVARCELRDGIRIFRLGRIEALDVNSRAMKTPDYAIPDSFDLADYTGRRPWELGEESEPVLARVRFSFPSSLWADRNGYGRLVEQRDDGAAVRELEVHQVDPFLRWVLSQAGEAAIEGPAELRVAYDDLVRRTAAVYAGSGAGA